MLPKIKQASKAFMSNSKKVFIVAEGFEKRSLHWISQPENATLFDMSIICKYVPSKKSQFEDMLVIVQQHTKTAPQILEYNRFEPTLFEQEFRSIVSIIKDFDEIIIDISVMSKLLIMIIMCLLRDYNETLSIIYTEPSHWGPTQEKYNETMANKTHGTCIGLSSVGVGDVVRTPNLSSIVMQNCPILLIAFLSFNEQLINVVVNEISPTKLQLINNICDRDSWREAAMKNIHKDLIDEYFRKDIENIFSVGLTDYDVLFQRMSRIYKDKCYDYRIVISPTGCKLHAVSCALLKLCCPDIHIEYPTPESYLFEDYSSDEIYKVHEIDFKMYNKMILDAAVEYGLNG